MKPDNFIRWLRDPGRKPLIMGVLNATPDSFSDGGQFASSPASPAQSRTDAVMHARQMLAAGADWIDIGGESTRPGSQPIATDEQIRRVEPVLRGIAAEDFDGVISIDTTDSVVAAAALDNGATIVNDISAGLFDRNMFELIARRGAAVVLMHMQGTPATMQHDPHYTDVVAEVTQFLSDRRDAAVAAGIDPQNILLDPGIGFGKSVDHNLQLLQQTAAIAKRLGCPLVVGPSRKGSIGVITREPEPRQRLFGTAACVAWCITNGASVVRVHDVGPMYQVVRMIRAIQAGHCAPDGQTPG